MVIKKVEYGQFFTKKDIWLSLPVREFIANNLFNKTYILDPFAGNGDLFNSFGYFFNDFNFKFVGYDIDKTMNWKINDSLLNIPIANKKKTFLITNPPYLAKNSCKRKELTDTYNRYFLESKYDDLYLIALERIIDSNVTGIAIVPETFINSNFPKNKVNRIVIIEPNPFEDTETPICVVCFNDKKNEELIIYKNDDKIDTYKNLKKKNPTPDEINLTDLRFNNNLGKIALIGVDSTNPINKIKFLHKEELKYNLNKIGNSSRAITIIKSEKLDQLDFKEISLIITYANEILNNFRIETSDALLSPFKGNNKNNLRRRRLDFKTARNILELSYFKYMKGVIN